MTTTTELAPETDRRHVFLDVKTYDEVWIVNAAIDHMTANLDREVTLEELARKAHYGKFYFARIFAKITGVNPGRYLTCLRYKKAAHLLKTTKLKVSDIAQLVGYTSVGTFSTAFTTFHGCPPTTYRMLHHTNASTETS